MKYTQVIDLFQRARKDQSLAVIEGIQALKHAVRFDAEIMQILSSDIALIRRLINDIAPDASKKILSQIEVVEESTFNKLSPQPPRTKVIALAKRRRYTGTDLDPAKPLVFLEDPRDLENIGAVIRVCAAADIAGVCISGPADVWHPAVIRGAAGLQYALPVLNDTLEAVCAKREVISLDPSGETIQNTVIQKGAVLIFGTERYGISNELLKRSDATVRLPMKAGVSSLNLATSVAATLYMM
jgi:TrmH family RNA methyltransferase